MSSARTPNTAAGKAVFTPCLHKRSAGASAEKLDDRAGCAVSGLLQRYASVRTHSIGRSMLLFPHLCIFLGFLHTWT